MGDRDLGVLGLALDAAPGDISRAPIIAARSATCARLSRSAIALAYVGYDVVAPYVAYGVETGLRYSETATVEGRLRTIVADFRATLPRIGRRDTIAFNRMEEWGPDGRLAPGAPVRKARGALDERADCTTSLVEVFATIG